jgi:hypothetical protein
MKTCKWRHGHTHRVVSEHHGGRNDRYDDPKKKQKNNRLSNDLMRNRFPNRSVR